MPQSRAHLAGLMAASVPMMPGIGRLFQRLVPEQRLRLGAERLQLIHLCWRQVFLLLPPLHGLLETLLGLGGVAKALMAHRQEEIVVARRFPLADLQAALERCHGLLAAAQAVV